MKAYTYEHSHRVTTDITYVQQHTGAKKWKDKISKALFRGRDSNEGRLSLAMWNRSEPLLDAGITSQRSTESFLTDHSVIIGPVLIRAGFGRTTGS